MFCNKFGFILTPDEKPLELQPLFYYILSDDAKCSLLDVYKCNDVDNDTYVYIGEETFYCVQTHSFREVSVECKILIAVMYRKIYLF